MIVVRREPFRIVPMCGQNFRIFQKFSKSKLLGRPSKGGAGIRLVFGWTCLLFILNYLPISQFWKLILLELSTFTAVSVNRYLQMSDLPDSVYQIDLRLSSNKYTDFEIMPSVNGTNIELNEDPTISRF